MIYDNKIVTCTLFLDLNKKYQLKMHNLNDHLCLSIIDKVVIVVISTTSS